MKLFVLLYAADTVILSENEHELQQALYGVYNYYLKHGLHINIDKIKIVIFFGGKMKKYPVFNYGDSIIEVVNDYACLGVTTNYNNKFATALWKQLDQGRRAQFSLLVKDLPIDSNVYNSIKQSSLYYDSEGWGFSCIHMLESFHR